MPVDTSGNPVAEQSEEQLEEIKQELAQSLGEEVAAETVKATKSVNELRAKHGIPPIQVDIETTKKAQDYLSDYIFGLATKGRRRLDGEGDEECGQNLYKEEDENVEEVTSDMAVAAWYEQKKYFNHETGLPVEGHETEAEEYL